MKFLLSSPAYNQDIQYKLLSLYEANALGAYYSTGVDHYRVRIAQRLRGLIQTFMPKLDKELQRRRVTLVPDEFIHSDWTWEALRTLTFRLKMNPSLTDWFWEKSEIRLDRTTAQLIKNKSFDAFIGSEHSCLATLKQSAKIGKPSAVIYLSPHHTAKKKWVDTEYEQFPELLVPSTKHLLKLAVERDVRRDEEAHVADVIITNSDFTTQSLIEAGIKGSKIITVPYGALEVIDESVLPLFSSKIQFMYAGSISVHKGTHYLLKAWKLAQAQLKDAELHFWGTQQLPQSILASTPNNVFFHGSVPQARLFQEYTKHSVLIFPTLLDGFGLVVTEAMSHGLPVITTPNAGAADLIEEGENGFLVPPKNSEALVERIIWCVEHPHELHKMRYRALETAKQHSWLSAREDFRRKLGQALGISFTVIHPHTKL